MRSSFFCIFLIGELEQLTSQLLIPHEGFEPNLLMGIVDLLFPQFFCFFESFLIGLFQVCELLRPLGFANAFPSGIENVHKDDQRESSDECPAENVIL